VNTPKKHKHYDAIVAWAEGKPIQHRESGTYKWRDCEGMLAPIFTDSYEYRVKPETVKWRAYLYRAYSDQLIVYTATLGAHDVAAAEKMPGFVRWLGDWQETEV
jgi:hypothetical protein